MKSMHFDHSSQSISRKIFSWASRLQSESEIVFSEALGGFWVVSRYEDALAVTNMPDIFVTSKGINFPPSKSPVPAIPAESDPPLHAHYRAAMLPFLHPRAVRKYEGNIRATTRTVLARIAAQGGGDAMADLASHIPARAMAFAFGFSDEDALRFEEYFTALVNTYGCNDDAKQAKALDIYKSFLQEKLAGHDASRGEHTLVSSLMEFEIEGRKLTDEERLGLMWTTAGGAIDTTKHAIGHLVYQLGINREVRRKLIEEPSRIPAAIEESLRMDAPAFMMARTVTQDVTVNGVSMKEGDHVLIAYGFANRDETRFLCPHDMKIDRDENSHLTFGNGDHNCLGKYLARLELKIVAEELLATIPDYQLVNPDQHPILHGGVIWGFDTLPIRVPR